MKLNIQMVFDVALVSYHCLSICGGATWGGRYGKYKWDDTKIVGKLAGVDK